MNHVDTFSGIGAWSLAAKWMGWNTLAFCEKEPFCQQVLKKQFPRIPIHDDIFTFSGKPFRDRVDILTGSTPCQPFSQAGQRKGSNDERHLFPEFLRVVAECRPRWVVIENVYGLLNIESGRVFEAYNTSLESEGYSVQTICVPASALNAPHRRDRLWIVAHSNAQHERLLQREHEEQPRYREGLSSGNQFNISIITPNSTSDGQALGHTPTIGTQRQGEQGRVFQSKGDDRVITDADRERLERGIGTRISSQFNRGEVSGWDTNWVEVAAGLCGVDDGLPVELDGFKLTKSKHRENRLKALGNAIVPQIAYRIFRAIQEVEKQSVLGS